MATESLVERMFFRSCFRCPFAVASDLGSCLRTSSDVRAGQVAKNPASMALVQVCTVGLKAHWWMYWTRPALVIISYALQAKG